MDEQDKIIKRTAIHQDTINGLNGPATWPIQWWAEKGDVVWTGGVANREGYDFTNMYFKPGDVIVHKNVIQGDGTKPVGAFNIYPEDGTDVMREVLDGIREWDHGTVPDRWGVAEHPGQVRLEVPGTGKTLGMGWGDGLALASTAAGCKTPNCSRQASCSRRSTTSHAPACSSKRTTATTSSPSNGIRTSKEDTTRTRSSTCNTTTPACR